MLVPCFVDFLHNTFLVEQMFSCMYINRDQSYCLYYHIQ